MSYDTPLRRNLESLKKEAKRWLAAIRADDADARGRLERAVPGAKGSPGPPRRAVHAAPYLGYAPVLR